MTQAVTHHATAAPSGSASVRLPVLDVLRGVAVLGILLMNIQSFGRLSSEYLNPKALGEPPPLDWAVWIINHVVADGKFIAMLTVLFGAGIVIMAGNSRETADAFQQRFQRRMAWLFLFGLAHGMFLWPGDILAAYAVCGAIALRLRHRPTADLVWLGVLLLAAMTVLWMVFSAVLVFALPVDWIVHLATRFWVPHAELVYAEMERLTTGWLGSAGERALNALGAQAWMFVSDRFFSMLATMLFGMALVRTGFLTGQWSVSSYRRVVVAGLGVGVPVVLAGLWFNEVVSWDFRYSMFLGRVANHWASIAIAIAWIALFILLVKQDALGAVGRWLEAVGRMAMTNYLGQSIICVLIFYGIGLGLFSRLGYLELLAVVLLIWAFQIAFSLGWRSLFTMGPFEALWRRLANG